MIIQMKCISLKRVLLVLTGVILMLALFGCGKQKYKLILPAGFISDKDQYAAGTEVKVTFNFFATDTDYQFFSDADDVKKGFDDKDGYVFTFVMPERDVRFWVESRNSMVYIPEKTYTEKELFDLIDEERMVFDCYDATVGTVGGDCYTEYVLYRWNDEGLLLARYSKFDEEPEVKRVCKVPVSCLYDCLAAVGRNGMRSWKDGIAPTGSYNAIKFKEGGNIIRISSDDMPEDGFKAFGEIENVLSKAWSSYGPKGMAEDPGIGIIDDPIVEETDK